jgi:hypothetical protein
MADPNTCESPNIGSLYVEVSQAMANAAHNATAQQQQNNITSQAATTMGISTLLSIDTASEAAGTTKIYE